MGDSSSCDTGKRILQEIKKQRNSCKGLGENKEIMDDLSSRHRQETRRITSDLRSHTPDIRHVRGLLCSLKETIDTIFTTTLHRVGDNANNSTMKNSSRTEHAPGTFHEEARLRSQIKRVQEERDRLFMENGSLKQQVADLRSMLDEVQKDTKNLTSTESDDLVEFVGVNILDNVKHYLSIDDLQKMIDKKECIDPSTGYEPDLQEMETAMAINNGKKAFFNWKSADH